MLFRPFALALALLFYSAADAAATLIIVYHGADEAIIAADSLAINNAAVPPRPGLACKIQNFSDVVFAAATSSIPEGILAFDALSARTHPDLSPLDRVRLFNATTMSAFTRHHSKRKDTYRIATTLVLAFMSEGRAVVISRSLESEGGKLEADPEPRRTLSGKALIIGPHEGLDSSHFGPSIPSSLSRIIAFQAARSPTVGGPVDMIRITTNGTEWLNLKHGCAERE